MNLLHYKSLTVDGTSICIYTHAHNVIEQSFAFRIKLHSNTISHYPHMRHGNITLLITGLLLGNSKHCTRVVITIVNARDLKKIKGKICFLWAIESFGVYFFPV